MPRTAHRGGSKGVRGSNLAFEDVLRHFREDIGRNAAIEIVDPRPGLIGVQDGRLPALPRGNEKSEASMSLQTVAGTMTELAQKIGIDRVQERLHLLPRYETLGFDRWLELHTQSAGVGLHGN